MRLPKRLAVTRSPLENAREENERAGVVFAVRVGAAPPGGYFRALRAAVAESWPYGQPVDFVRLVEELAELEARVEALER